MKRSTWYYFLLTSGLVVCSVRQAVAYGTPPACPSGKVAEDCSGGQIANWIGGICPDSSNTNTALAGSSFSDSTIGISLLGSNAIWGEVVGVNYVGVCVATDTTVNGTSATDTTGCDALFGINWKVRNCYTP